MLQHRPLLVGGIGTRALLGLLSPENLRGMWVPFVMSQVADFWNNLSFFLHTESKIIEASTLTFTVKLKCPCLGRVFRASLFRKLNTDNRLYRDV